MPHQLLRGASVFPPYNGAPDADDLNLNNNSLSFHDTDLVSSA